VISVISPARRGSDAGDRVGDRGRAALQAFGHLHVPGAGIVGVGPRPDDRVVKAAGGEDRVGLSLGPQVGGKAVAGQFWIAGAIELTIK